MASCRDSDESQHRQGYCGMSAKGDDVIRSPSPFSIRIHEKQYIISVYQTPSTQTPSNQKLPISSAQLRLSASISHHLAHSPQDAEPPLPSLNPVHTKRLHPPNAPTSPSTPYNRHTPHPVPAPSTYQPPY
jgi:hypothetical protein